MTKEISAETAHQVIGTVVELSVALHPELQQWASLDHETGNYFAESNEQAASFMRELRKVEPQIAHSLDVFVARAIAHWVMHY